MQSACTSATAVNVCITAKYRVSEKDCTFQKFFFGPLLFGGRHLENFVPTGTAGISIKSRSI
jgi:hypothetical protein